MDILQPSLEQSPIFGNVSPSGASTLTEWQYSFYKFFFIVGDVLAVIFSQETWDIVKAILTVVSIFCITVMAYCAVRMFEIRKKEKMHLQEEIEEYREKQAEREEERKKTEATSSNPSWVRVINYLRSQEEANLKLAVIEADNMLDQLMSQLGFEGDSLGEKLKSADLNKFKDLPIAWEAHSIRNKIAHESDFVLSSREANRVVSLYQQIFHEYGFI